MGWQKGQSGNPKGRKKNITPATEIIEKMLRKRDVPHPTEEGKYISRREHLFKKLYDLAVGGDTSAMKLLIEHGWGRAHQTIEQDITSHTPAQVEFNTEIDSDEGVDD